MRRIAIKRLYIAIYLVLLLIPAAISTVSASATDLWEEEEPPPSSPALLEFALDSFLYSVPEDIEQAILENISGSIQDKFVVPIFHGVSETDITDSFGYARPNGSIHEGVDIFAIKDSLIISPTDAVVTNIGYDARGGNFVLTANPGGEQFYYAHLSRADHSIFPGKILRMGDAIGYVGNTGNAGDKAPHLHFAIYHGNTPHNPYPRFTRELSINERVDLLETWCSDPSVDLLSVINIVDTYQTIIDDAVSRNIRIPQTLEAVLEDKKALEEINTFNGDVSVGSSGKHIEALQTFLINNDSGSHAKVLSQVGPTGYFGSITKNALSEYQRDQDIHPASGIFGPSTKKAVHVASMRESAFQTLRAESDSDSNAVDSPLIERDQSLIPDETNRDILQRIWLYEFVESSANTIADSKIAHYLDDVSNVTQSKNPFIDNIEMAQRYFTVITQTFLAN